jgi:septum formation protein
VGVFKGTDRRFPPLSQTERNMLELLTRLQTQNIVLASASPRRRELLNQIGLQFKVIPSTFEENLDKQLYSAPKYAALTALHKAQDVYSHLSSSGQEIPYMVIGADTVVEHDGHILEKPDGEASARAMLRSLSGCTHQVHTGVAIILGSSEEQQLSFSETTTVSFMKFCDEDIDEYIASGEPFGKAGYVACICVSLFLFAAYLTRE